MSVTPWGTDSHDAVRRGEDVFAGARVGGWIWAGDGGRLPASFMREGAAGMRKAGKAKNSTSSAKTTLAIIGVFLCLFIYHQFRQLPLDVQGAIIWGGGLFILVSGAILGRLLYLNRHPEPKPDVPAITRRSPQFEIMQEGTFPTFGHKKPTPTPLTSQPTGRPGMSNAHATPDHVYAEKPSLAFLVYRSGSKRYTFRRITVRGLSFETNGQIKMVQAYCQSLSQEKFFDIKRCKRFIDPETGDDIPDLTSWIGATTGQPPVEANPSDAENDGVTIYGDPTLDFSKADQDVLLRYRDNAGHVTERRITLTAIDGHCSRDGVPRIDMIHAFCHLRHMPRSFAMDRIIMMANPETGEIIDDPAGWLGIHRRT